MLGHLDEVFPGVGVALAFPQDGGDVVGDVAGKAVQTVALDEGHHVVFEREEIVRTHSQASHSRRCGRVGVENVESCGRGIGNREKGRELGDGMGRVTGYSLESTAIQEECLLARF